MSTAELLRKAAEAMDRGEDPFGQKFLGDNGVTLDDCMTMAEFLAIGARLVAKGLDDPRSTIGIQVLMAIASSP